MTSQNIRYSTFNILFSLLLLLLLLYGPVLYKGFDIVENSTFSIKFFAILVGTFSLFSYVFLDMSGRSLKLTSLVWCALYLLLSSAVFHIACIFFGAPFIDNLSETFHLSILLCATSVFPGLCVIGLQSDDWIRVLFTDHGAISGREQAIKAVIVLSIVGTWLGAFPIPLDWDRAWQVWPVSCAIGCLLGHVVGLLVGSGCLIKEVVDQNKLKII